MYSHTFKDNVDVKTFKIEGDQSPKYYFTSNNNSDIQNSNENIIPSVSMKNNYLNNSIVQIYIDEITFSNIPKEKNIRQGTEVSKNEISSLKATDSKIIQENDGLGVNTLKDSTLKNNQILQRISSSKLKWSPELEEEIKVIRKHIDNDIKCPLFLFIILSIIFEESKFLSLTTF